MNLQEYHKKIKSYFELKTERERRVITYVLPLMVGAIMFSLIVSPLRKSAEEIQEKSEKLAIEIKTTEVELLKAKNLLAKLQEQPLDEKVKNFQLQLDELDSQIAVYAKKLVSASEAVTLIKDLLDGSRQMKLKSIENSIPKKDEKVASESGVELWTHEIRLNLAADYFSLVKFLKDFEMKQQSVKVKTVKMTVENYPSIESQIVFEVVSLDKEMISV